MVMGDLNNELVIVTKDGLFCPRGNFHIDPWNRVERALITHAHSDHARWGSQAYLCAEPCEKLLKNRLGDVRIETRRYGENIDISGVRVSFHPAGPVLGSAQIRLESQGRIWAVSGDYKLQADPTCTPFEPIRVIRPLKNCRSMFWVGPIAYRPASTWAMKSSGLISRDRESLKRVSMVGTRSPRSSSEM